MKEFVYKLSLFHEGLNKKGAMPFRTVSIDQVYNMVKGDSLNPTIVDLRDDFTDKLKPRVEWLRALEDEKEQRDYKLRSFPYVTPAGVMTGRDDSDLRAYSGLLCMDIDRLGGRLPEVREALLRDPNFCTVMLFVSPRGNGLKWWVDITRQLQRYEYPDIYMAVSRYLCHTYGLEMKVQVDISCKNVGRACYLSYDPDCYFNDDYKYDPFLL